MADRATATRSERALATAIPGVRHIVAVASGKGGVGKSTIAVNLAVALKAMGFRVGLLDADVYGPSAPLMLGAEAAPRPGDGNQIRPVEQHGIHMISMGFFLDDTTPVIWRGPLAMSATKQFLRGVAWGELDYLVVDLPPGTGDVALTLAQEVPLSGGVVVTTPQDVALADVRRGVAMLRQLRAPVIGVIENMSGYVCERCGTRDDVFGSRPARDIEAELGASVIAEVPLTAALCQMGDAGTPIVAAQPEHAVSRALAAAAARVCNVLDGDSATADETHQPVEVEFDEHRGAVNIRWMDGHASTYPLAYLRGWCPCAGCQGHGGGRRFVRTAVVELASWEPVGRYAICFRWRDGHDTGIYSHDYLRELCACRLCKPAGVTDMAPGSTT